MSDTDFVVFRLCNQNLKLSQRQIDVNLVFIFNQNATSVRRHVQRQPDVT